MTETLETTNNNKGTILVIGSGISGLTTTLEAAEVGYRVILLEKESFLGGRVARTHKYFPKLCPPNCGLEINYRRLKSNPRIDIYTQAEVTSISGKEGNFAVTATLRPRFVNQKCTACGDCIAVCPVERSNDFNLGIDNNKAIYCSSSMSFPMTYVIDSTVCPGTSCNKCVDVCKYEAIDLNMKEETITFRVASIVLATGWRPYDAKRIDNLGFGRFPNVVTNVMMERFAAHDGPTKGKVLRPSDGKEPKKVAFVQCAGSRDENHLPYCSSVCCLASLKQFHYLKELYPDIEATMYYIDLRAPGRLEDFLTKMDKEPGLHLTKGKVAKVAEDPVSRNILIEVEDTLEGKKIKDEVDLLVLATGMQPNPVPPALCDVFTTDEYGFAASDRLPAGIYACGVARAPVDVSFAIQDATGIALRAIQSAVGR